MTYRYRAYQLLIEATFPLIGFPPCCDEGEADIQVRLGEFPGPISALPWKVTESEVFLWYRGVGAFCVREGREITVRPVRGVKLARLALFLRSSVWAALMLQRGWLPLHGSCLDSPNGAVLLLGSVGVGKSTLATALQYKGFALVCDEMAVLKEGRIVPAVPEVRLWGQSLRAFGVPKESWGPPVRGPFPKFALAPLKWCGEARSPRAIFFLSEGGAAIQVAQISAQEALGQALGMLYRYRLAAQMPALWERLGVALSGLVGSAASLSLSIPRSLALVPELCEVVEEGLSRSKPAGEVSARVDFFPPPEKGPGRPGLALLVAFPHSGNGWMEAVLGALGLAKDGSRLFRRHTLDEALGIDSDYLGPGELLEWRALMHSAEAPSLLRSTFVKTHDRCSRGRGGNLLYPPEAVAGVVYMVRCPLDLALAASAQAGIPLPAAVNMLSAQGAWGQVRLPSHGVMLPQPFGSWSGHVDSWVNESSYQQILVRYEDLLADPEGQLKRILEFFEIPWDDARAQAALKVMGGKPIGPPAFGWRAVMPPELARRIAEAHAPAMRRMGYGAEVDAALKRPRRRNWRLP